MAPRRESRERALGLCYEGEVRELAPEAVLANLPVAPDDYAVRLLEGVHAHRDAIDAHLAAFSEHWTVERMPVVDRCILRIAAYELGYEPEVPTAVAISEAVDLAKRFGATDGYKFVNGVLDRAAVELRPHERDL